jgi:hypothetical protein
MCVHVLYMVAYPGCVCYQANALFRFLSSCLDASVAHLVAEVTVTINLGIIFKKFLKVILGKFPKYS